MRSSRASRSLCRLLCLGLALELAHGQDLIRLISDDWVRCAGIDYLRESAGGGDVSAVTLDNCQDRGFQRWIFTDSGSVESLFKHGFCWEARPGSPDIGVSHLKLKPCLGSAAQTFALTSKQGRRTICLAAQPQLCLVNARAWDFGGSPILLADEGLDADLLELRPFEAQPYHDHFGEGALSGLSRRGRHTVHSNATHIYYFEGVLVVSHILLALGLLSVLSVLVVSCCRFGLAELGRQAAGIVRRTWKKACGGAEVGRALRRKGIFATQRLVRARLGITAGLLFMILILCRWLPSMQEYRARWTCSTSEVRDAYPCQWSQVWGVLYHTEIVPTCMVMPVFLMIFIFPARLTTRGLDVLNTYCTAVLLVHRFTENLFNGFVSWPTQGVSWRTMARLFEIVLCGNARVSVPLQVLYSASEILVKGVDYLQEMGTLSSLLVCFMIFDHMAWANAMAVEEAMRSSHSEALVVTLLEGVHDAVLHVKSDMTITRPCPALAALLMHTSPEGQSLEGTNFLNGCHESERVRVQEKFCDSEAQGENVSVHMMMVKLCDVHGSTFDAELMWAFMPGEADCFVVGIRETGERAYPPAAFDVRKFPTPGAAEPAKPSAQTPRSCSSHASALQVPCGRAAPRSPSVDQGSDGTVSEATSLATSDEPFEATSLATSDEPFAAVVDVSDFRIMACSSRFSMFLGKGVEDDFRSAFFDKLKFELWWTRCRLEQLSLSTDLGPLLFVDILKVVKRQASMAKHRTRMGKRVEMHQVAFEVLFHHDPGEERVQMARVTVVQQRSLGFCKGRAAQRVLQGASANSRVLKPVAAPNKSIAQASQQATGDTTSVPSVELQSPTPSSSGSPSSRRGSKSQKQPD